MATSKRKASATSPKARSAQAAEKNRRESATDYRRSYVRLRTQLDALEIAAVRYFLEGADAAEMERRAQELENQIMPIITGLQQRGFGSGCPDGLFNCGGCCVPYPCPRET